jgi:predicted nucleotidyltransferase
MGGLEVLDARYVPLWERARAVLEADERVRSVAVGGSVAAGTADAWSDLDLHVIADADRYDEFLADWPSWLEAITPTVFARTPIAPFIINAVTSEGLTLDLVVYKGEAFVFPRATDYTVGMLSSTRFSEVADALEYAVAELLRGLAGPFITLVQRGEHLRHVSGGVPHLLGLLTTAFLAETGSPPPGKLWNASFTTEQLAAVEKLPPVRATRDSVVSFALAVAELTVTRARPLFARYGLDWPAPLAAVAATRLREQLALETAAWLR